MAGKITLEVAEPRRQLINEQVDEVQAPAVDGYLGVLPGHAPLLTELGAGVLTFKQESKARYLALNGGFMEILPNRVRVLADEVHWASEVDVEQAHKDLERAMGMLEEHGLEMDVEAAQRAVAAAKSRLQAWEQANGRG